MGTSTSAPRQPTGAPAPMALSSMQRSVYPWLVHRLPHAVLLLDSALHVVLANEAGASLFQKARVQLRGLPISALIPQGNLDRLLAEPRAQKTRIIETSFTPRMPPDSAALTLKIVAVRMDTALKRGRAKRTSASEGAPAYQLLVLEDISDRARLEQQLVESEKQAAMGQLAAGLLHEIANPLASLGSNLLFVCSSADGQQRQEIKRALDVSLEQLNHMRQLLGTLSGFPGRAFPRFETSDLHELVRWSTTFVSAEARRRHVRIALSLSPSKIVCEMDVRLIRQVLLNLLKNSMEAMPDGGRIDVRTRERTGDAIGGPAALIEIADTGVGIADADLRRVFRPLFSTKPRGAGLGLSFCRQTIEEHGGYIRVASAGVNQGATATVCLPLHQSCTLYENE